VQSTHKSTAGVLNRRHRFRFLVLAVAFESGLGVLAWFIGWLVGVPIVEQFSWSLLGLAWRRLFLYWGSSCFLFARVRPLWMDFDDQ